MSAEDLPGSHDNSTEKSAQENSLTQSEQFPSEDWEFSPDEVLNYWAKLGENLITYSDQALAMMAKAKEQNIEIDPATHELIDKLKPRGEFELQLLQIRDALSRVGTNFYLKGVLMDKDEYTERLEEIEKQRK